MTHDDNLREFAEECVFAHEFGSLEYRLAIAYLESTRAASVPSNKVRVEALESIVHIDHVDNVYDNQFDVHVIPSEYVEIIRNSLTASDQSETIRKFKLGERVTKTKGSKWTGRVVGFYSTELTKIGYAVESETETGSVQIYPEQALALAEKGGV